MADKFFQVDKTTQRLKYYHTQYETLCEQDKQTLGEGYFVSDIPVPPEIPGKVGDVYYDAASGQFYFKYEDIPPVENLDVDQLQQQVRDLNQTVSSLQAQLQALNPPEV